MGEVWELTRGANFPTPELGLGAVCHVERLKTVHDVTAELLQVDGHTVHGDSGTMRAFDVRSTPVGACASPRVGALAG